eukprot:15473926-Alexandrium_andersonii.AAC.1
MDMRVSVCGACTLRRQTRSLNTSVPQKGEQKSDLKAHPPSTFVGRTHTAPCGRGQALMLVRSTDLVSPE